MLYKPTREDNTDATTKLVKGFATPVESIVGIGAVAYPEPPLVTLILAIDLYAPTTAVA